MKKILSLRAWSAASLMAACVLLASCVLTLESPPEDKHRGTADPEDVGFDEPYTLETQYGDCTFQYAERTQVLKKKALDYLVKVEHDSILYFTDNIPKELLIQPGYYVSMVANKDVPMGLNAKVIELSQKDGMYKMVTTSATLEEVFEVYDVDFDCRIGNVDYLPLADSAELVAQGIDVDTMPRISTALLDGYEMSDEEWNYTPQTDPDYEMQTDEETNTKFYVRKRPRTEDGGAMRRRAKSGEELDNDDDDQGNKDGGDVQNEVLNKYKKVFNVSTTNHTWMNRFPTLKKFTDNGMTLAIEVGYGSKLSYSTHVKVNHDDPKKTVRETTIKDHSYFALKPTISWSKYDTNYSLAENYQRMKPLMKLTKTWIKPRTEWMKARFYFATPVPGLILAIIITPTLSFEVGLYGSAEIHINSPATETHTKYVGDEKTEESSWTDPNNSTPSLTIESMSVGGYMEVTGGIDAFFAGTLAGSAGAGGGARITASAKFLAEYDFLNSDNPKYDKDIIYLGENMKNIRFEFKAGIKPYVAAYVRGDACFDFEFDGAETDPYKIYCYPDIRSARATVDDIGGGKIKFTGNYSFSSPGWIMGLGFKDFEPKMAVALTDINTFEVKKVYVLDEKSGHLYKSDVKILDTQRFEKDITVPDGISVEDCYYLCFPILYFKPKSGSSKMALSYSENGIMVRSQKNPLVIPSKDTYLLAKEYNPGSGDPFDFDNPPTYKYTMGMVADIINTQHFKDTGWTEWGIEISEIYYRDFNTSKNYEETRFKTKRWKVDPKMGDGKYLFKFTVTTDYTQDDISTNILYRFYYEKDGKRNYVKEPGGSTFVGICSAYPSKDVQQGPTTAKGLTLGATKLD